MASPGTDVNEMLGAAYDNAPQFLQLLNDASNANIMPAAQANLAAAQQVTPQYDQLLTQLLGEYAPQLAQIGLQTGQQIQQGQANANAAVANSTGGQGALQAAINADKTANPEFYTSRANESNALSSLLSTDVAGLSGQLNPTEITAIGQSIAQQGNQTGTFNTPSAIQTTANAMNYGNAVYNRQEQAKNDLSSALGQATSFLPASQSGVGGMNAWNIATGGANTATNTAAGATGLFSGTTNTSGGANTSALSSALGSVVGGSSSTYNSGLAENASKENTSQTNGVNFLTKGGLSGVSDIAKTIGSFF